LGKISFVKEPFENFLSNQEGSPAIEYSLIAGLIGIVIIVSLTLTGTKLNTLYASIKTSLLGI